MTFRGLLTGYHVATSNVTGDEYVIRTRPKGDGWMAINDTEGIVLATSIADFSEAKATCESYDKQVAESITPNQEGN